MPCANSGFQHVPCVLQMGLINGSSPGDHRVRAGHRACESSKNLMFNKGAYKILVSYIHLHVLTEKSDACSESL